MILRGIGNFGLMLVIVSYTYVHDLELEPESTTLDDLVIDLSVMKDLTERHVFLTLSGEGL